MRFKTFLETPSVDPNDPFFHRPVTNYGPKPEDEKKLKTKAKTINFLNNNLKDFQILIYELNNDDVVFFVKDTTANKFIGRLATFVFDENFLQVASVNLDPNYRDKKIPSSLYDTIILSYKSIISGSSLTKTLEGGSYFLWQRFINHPSINLFYFDDSKLNNNKLISDPNYLNSQLLPVDKKTFEEVIDKNSKQLLFVAVKKNNLNEMPVKDNEFFNINTDTTASKKQDFYEPDESHKRINFSDPKLSDFFIVVKTINKAVTFLVVEKSEFLIVAKLNTSIMDDYLRISSITVNQDYRSKGIAFNLYLTIIENYKGVISDSSLSKTNSKKGSYFLWQKLSQHKDVTVSYMDMDDYDDYNQINIKPLKKFDSVFGKHKGHLRYVASKK